MYTITVTNLNDSGSLRQTIINATVYTGDDEIQIVFDSGLCG